MATSFNHVFLTISEDLARPALVLLRSILDTVSVPCHFHFVHLSSAAPRQKRTHKGKPFGFAELAKVAVGAGHKLEVKAFDVPEGATEWALAKGYSLEVFLRLLLPYLFPTVKRGLYLDSDMLARRDIAPLLAFDLGGAHFAAARYLFPLSLPAYNGFNSVTYLNSGALVIDFEKWREIPVETLCAKIRAKLETGMVNDEMPLNKLVEEGFFAAAVLPPEWNVFALLTEEERCWHLGRHAGFSEEQLSAARDDPAIVHYPRRLHPWLGGVFEASALMAPFVREWLMLDAALHRETT